MKTRLEEKFMPRIPVDMVDRLLTEREVRAKLGGKGIGER